MVAAMEASAEQRNRFQIGIRAEDWRRLVAFINQFSRVAVISIRQMCFHALGIGDI
jgi:hypothetical protein